MADHPRRRLTDGPRPRAVVSGVAGFLGSHLAERPVYSELFRAVRDLNHARRRDGRLRILLGDPPIDWATVKTPADYRPWAFQRDSHPAALIRREVLERSRKALVIYGDGHFQARRERPGRSLVSILETAGTSVFTITSTFADLTRFDPAVAAWRVPALAMLQGTTIGEAPYEDFFGPAPTTILYPRCAEPDYVAMRVARMAVAGLLPGTADRLAAECEAGKGAAGTSGT